MEAILNVKLDAELVENLKRATTAQGITIEQALDGLARKYLAEARRQAIDREFANYRAMHAELVNKYLGENVAIYQGKLIDHDPEPMTLARRIRETYGSAPVLVTLVREKAVQEFTLKSPRDVLNKLPILLDGPTLQSELLDDATTLRLRARRER
ncbi:MAG: hypothetical protein B6D41_16020 [Chloroflexi bacterium UTCFX4]|nr:MAG: hypothetical protein B6D41_16020 [Chloroflexi bacterium UTCFX4]